MKKKARIFFREGKKGERREEEAGRRGGRKKRRQGRREGREEWKKQQFVRDKAWGFCYNKQRLPTEGNKQAGFGELPKRFKGAHSKCVRPGDRCVGSNPMLSAFKKPRKYAV